MTPFGLAGLLTGITSVSFGIFVLSMSANRKIGRIWFVFTLAVGVWGFGGMWISWTRTASEGLLAWRLAYAFGVVWIAPLFTTSFAPSLTFDGTDPLRFTIS